MTSSGVTIGALTDLADVIDLIDVDLNDSVERVKRRVLNASLMT